MGLRRNAYLHDNLNPRIFSVGDFPLIEIRGSTRSNRVIVVVQAGFLRYKYPLLFHLAPSPLLSSTNNFLLFLPCPLFLQSLLFLLPSPKDTSHIVRGTDKLVFSILPFFPFHLFDLSFFRYCLFSPLPQPINHFPSTESLALLSSHVCLDLESLQ
ncbi:hypothetical protein VTK56DRAFT_5135 [Thermocarpiscus australiensis]